MYSYPYRATQFLERHGCRHKCHCIVDHGYNLAIDHRKPQWRGLSYYYCSIHRVYHCINTSLPRYGLRPQPSCGECAWVFFQDPSDFPTRLAPCDQPDEVAEEIHQGRYPLQELLENRIRLRLDPWAAVGRSVENEHEQIHPNTQSSVNHNLHSHPANPSTPKHNHEQEPLTIMRTVSKTDYDSDGDVIMRNGGQNEEGDKAAAGVDEHRLDAKTSSCPPPSPKFCYMSVGASRAILQAIPYNEPELLNIRYTMHDTRRGIALFRYVDINGVPGIQPAGNDNVLQLYLQPIDELDLMTRADPVLIWARQWTCWAQGFRNIEPEIRWALTLMFDFVNTAIESYKHATASAPQSLATGYPGVHPHGHNPTPGAMF